MKEKILKAIKEKFPTAKLSAKRLDAIAASVEAKAGTDESLIDGTLDALNELYPLADIAKDDHIRSTLEGKLKATQTKKDEKDDATKDEPAPDDTPAYIKAMMAKLDTVTGELAAIKGEKAATTIKGKATELLKDVPASYWSKRAMPDKMEDLEAFVTEVSTDYTAFKQEWTDQGLNVLSAARPGGGTGGPPASKDISPEIKAFVESKQKIQAQAK